VWQSEVQLCNTQPVSAVLLVLAWHWSRCCFSFLLFFFIFCVFCCWFSYFVLLTTSLYRRFESCSITLMAELFLWLVSDISELRRTYLVFVNFLNKNVSNSLTADYSVDSVKARTASRCLVWAMEHCRISPSRFLTECCRWLNQGRFVLLYFALFAVFWVVFSLFIFVYCFVCQYQSSDWLWRLSPKQPRLCQVGR